MLQKYSGWRVLQAFFLKPTTKLSLAEISRHADLAHTAVKNHLEELERDELIVRETIKLASRTYPVYRAAYDNPRFKQAKILANIDAFRPLIEAIADASGPRCIVLFGSCRYGEDTEESDIDLYVIAKQVTINLKPFEKTLQRRINIIFSENLTGSSAEFKNNLINGIVLHGYLKAF